MKLIEFTIKTKDGIRHFVANGEVDIGEIENGLHSFETYKVKMMELLPNGKKKKFVPDTVSWIGRKLTEQDAVEDIMCRKIQNEIGNVVIIYICKELQDIISEYYSKGIALNVNRDIPKVIYSPKYLDFMEIALITDKYTFYKKYENVIMINTQTGEIISDNFFAEVGYLKAIKEIQKGEQKHLYGEIFEV